MLGQLGQLGQLPKSPKKKKITETLVLRDARHLTVHTLILRVDHLAVGLKVPSRGGGLRKDMFSEWEYPLNVDICCCC